jgi:histidine triad (HIT) family protein
VENTHVDSPFVGILRGEQPGKIITRDDEKRFAIIASLEPEASIHWLAVPFDPGYTTEEMEAKDSERFVQLVNYAITETRARVEEHPELATGFTIKFHCGAYETIPHAKLHILSIE